MSDTPARVCRLDPHGEIRVEGETVYVGMYWEDTGQRFELKTSREQFYTTLLELQLTLRASGPRH